MPSEWVNLDPPVNREAEFFEIANDFGNPLEILREALSNSIDAGATEVHIRLFVEEVDGAEPLVIEIEDNGSGMTRDVLTQGFWGLGFSSSRQDKDKIGEKGHGTKIYLRSERVLVLTQSDEGCYESVCERPLRSLARRECHRPRIRDVDNFRAGTGTRIRVEGYNRDERSQFVQAVVKDYILWFTKVGSIERIFKIDRLAHFHCTLNVWT